MEVVQTGPLVCASRPSTSHPPPHPRLSHRLDGDPTSALHVQTEEGGGGLDPSWWKISASGSWDGGERRMRYGKMVDDRSGGIPGAVQRRKLEMLETHAPGASMRVVHSQSTASWVQNPSDSNSTGLNSNISPSRRSVLSSSSSSTRVTSFRQWSSNFTQNSTNVGIKHETRPSITEFGNLELALNPLDVSFLRTRGNVGRSGSISARRPPSRGRRFSSDSPLGSPVGNDHSKTPSPILIGDDSEVRIHDVAVESRREEKFEGAQKEGSEWPPVASSADADADDTSSFSHRLQTVLHRKRSVSSEDVRAAEEMDEDESAAEDPESKWRRGAVVRRSLPSSEWRSVVEAADATRQRLRPRDPFKSSSVPALGGISSSRRGSFVTAESLREMKGRLKHRGVATEIGGRSKTTETPTKNGEAAEDAGSEDVPSKTISSPFLLRVAAREEPSGVRQQQEGQDDRRKSWSVGCRAFVKRGFDEDNDGASNRRRSYAFEYSAEENGSSEDRKNHSVTRQLQERRGDAQRGKLWVDSHPYIHNRVNEVLKKWSALSKGDETEEREDMTRAPGTSPIVSRRSIDDEREDSPVKNSSTWLEPNEFQESSAGIEVSEFSPATMTSGGRTTLRVIPSKVPHYKDDASAEVCVQEQVTSDSSFNVSGESMEGYMSSHGIAPIDWAEDDSKPSKDAVKTEAAATSAGISVTFSNADGDNSAKLHCSVTHLDNREGDANRTEMQGFKMRSSKKVEFSKTEVHFAAESGRFHIVETAGKPPPSNNFRRRRRSPTGTMNVDSGDRLGTGVGSQAVVTNGMRFGDSPYEMRLLAGSEGLEYSSRRNEEDYADEQGKLDDVLTDGEGFLEYKALPTTKAKVFNELVIEELRETKEMQSKIPDDDAATSSSTFLHLGMDDLSPDKPRSILRSIAAENLSPWKSPHMDVDDPQNEDFKPKFGGVRLRPVVSTVAHSMVNVTNPELVDPSGSMATDKVYSDALSPGQMELQKLLRSLRHVSMTYSDNPSDPNTTSTQVANGGGMEVRISSSSQSAVTNTVIIGSDTSDIHTPLSVAQRVREVEERRQKELLNRVAGNQRPATRVCGQFSTRVTLGSTSSSVVSLDSQVPKKTSVSQIESAKPVSPKPAAKLSTLNNKIARIHNAQGIASRLAGDNLQHSQVDTTSEIKISARVTENRAKLEHSKDVPTVTCIALGYQDKAKDTMKNAESKDELKERTGHSTVPGGKFDGSLGESSKRITSKSVQAKLEGREKSPEEAIHSRPGKYVSSPPKDSSIGWRCIDAKNKKEDDLSKSGLSVKAIRSQRQVKEIASNVVEKSSAKATFTALSSPIAEHKNYSDDTTGLETFKDETRIDDTAGNFSIKMKVIKNEAEEEKSTVGQELNFQGQAKTNSQSTYLHQRRTNTITTASKFSDSEISAQKSRKESSPKAELRTLAMQSSKSPTMDQRIRLQAASSRSGNPEISSPSSGRAVRKRLRKRGSGGSSKTLSSSDRRREGPEDDSSILEELTKAADEILHAVNGYSDEASSDEDVDATKSEMRSKRRPAMRKESATRKLSSSSGRDPKSGGSQRTANQKIREARTRTTNGMMSPSTEGAQSTLSETGTESQRASRGSHAGLSGAASVSNSPNSHGRSSNTPVISEKSQRSKQQPLLGASKKSMTRIEPTTRVAEVKLIEKRPPLPPTGQRKPGGLKERSEAPARGALVKPKTTASFIYNKDGDAEVIKDTKRPINIARALEAVMPDSRTKTRKIDRKIETTSIPKASDSQKKDNPSTSPASAQSSSGTSNSLERKKVASSRDGDKTTRRRAHQNTTSPT